MKKVYYLSYDNLRSGEPLEGERCFVFRDLSYAEELTLVSLANRNNMHLYCELIAEE